MDALDPEQVLHDQQLYYSLRAGEYDRGETANAEWTDDMTRLQTAFDAVPVGGDVIELAAGTGAWTERLVARAESLTVLDGSPEMLDVNRTRLGAAAASVRYEVVDLFTWHPPRTWDACVFGFWLCKVPDERIARFLATVAEALRDDGVVCCVDKAADAEPPSELEERTLDSGRSFTIFDHPRPPDRLVTAFATAGMAVEIQTFGRRFCLVSGRKTSAKTPA